MRIFIDLDNTICDYNESALGWYNAKLQPEVRLQEKDLTDYEIPKDFGVVGEYEIKQLNKKMWETEGFWRGMEPVKGALNVVRELDKRHDVWIKTHAQMNWNCIVEKHEWIRVHLRDLAEKIIFVPSHDLSILNGDVLIDDDYRALSMFQGKRVMLKQYYNIQMSEMFGYYVSDWGEIKELFDGII